MKQWNLTVNYVQNCCVMQYSMPSIVAKNLEDALDIARSIMDNIFVGVLHVSVNAITQVQNIDLGA